MSARFFTSTVLAIAALVIGAGSGPAAAQDVVATDPAGTTIAQAAPEQATGPQAAASIPRGIIVTRPGGRAVTLSARGQATLRKPRPGRAAAVFTDLRAGTTYTVRVGGHVIGHVMALDRPKAASALTVTSARASGAVDLAWRHSVTAATGGRAIVYDVAATTAGGSTLTTSVTSRTTAQLSGLDPTALYTFSVTPRNTAGKGKASVAVMRRTLAELTAGSADTSKVVTPTLPAPEVRPTPTPTPAPAAAPAPAPAPAAPATKTIYVCPDGYPPVGDVCQKTQPYTYELKSYTFHSEDIHGYGQTGWTYSAGHCTGSGNSGNWANGDPYCQLPVYGNDAVIGTQLVKDAPPTGYTDNGTAWSKKGTPPPGYLDDGTQWVLTVVKVAKVVPA